ncbi:uncharacterized protein LOC135497035 [Lineus longissimus]|uniref:uncharacterized protein LOC135497035 n=1 Tax=Lineus longissimus TaxID=88925 RepID=UPI002B4EF629
MVNATFLVVCATVAFVICASPGGAQDMELSEEAELEVPGPLKADCEWVRRDDTKKPWTITTFFKSIRRSTELKCKDECDKRVICGYAVFNNRTRECQLVPRRAFHESYLTAQGIFVMWEKECPIEHIWNRDDDPSRMVMCPMKTPTDSSARLSPKYAYKVAKYIDNDYDAVWWCQRDPVCQGVYRNRTYNNIHVFLYKAVSVGADEATGEISEVRVKNCTPSEPLVGDKCFFTAYNRKVVNTGTNGTAYQVVKYKNFQECYSMCLQNNDCYAAAADEDSFRRGRSHCRLYRKESFHGLQDFKKMFDNAKVWVRDFCGSADRK